MTIQKQVAETMSGALEPESPRALVSDARAAEIRSELTAKHGALWLHYYHRAIEAEIQKPVITEQRFHIIYTSASGPLHISFDTEEARAEWFEDLIGDGEDYIAVDGLIDNVLDPYIGE